MWTARRSIAIRRIGEVQAKCCDALSASSPRKRGPSKHRADMFPADVQQGLWNTGFAGTTPASVVGQISCLRPRAFHATLVDIFLAVNRPDVWGIAIEIGPPNPVLWPVL